MHINAMLKKKQKTDKTIKSVVLTVYFFYPFRIINMHVLYFICVVDTAQIQCFSQFHF